MTIPKQKRGFALMSPEKQRELASKGSKASTQSWHWLRMDERDGSCRWSQGRSFDQPTQEGHADVMETLATLFTGIVIGICFTMMAMYLSDIDRVVRDRRELDRDIREAISRADRREREKRARELGLN